MKMKSMQKSVLAFTVVALALVAAPAFAQDQSSGCGLGWQVTQKNSLVSSSVRTTTNTFLPNTFSMTFGSSGCTKHSIVMNEKQQQYFVESNLNALSIEMAQGDGEYLRNFAAVMGCGSDTAGFSRLLQSHYGEVFPAASPDASEVLNRVKAEIRSDAAMSLACASTS